MFLYVVFVLKIGQFQVVCVFTMFFIEGKNILYICSMKLLMFNFKSMNFEIFKKNFYLQLLKI